MTATLSFSELCELENFVQELADLAGETILPFFRQGLLVDNKLGDGGYDPVTKADRDAELALRALIERRFPSHGILGEEHGHKRGTSPLTWVIDPIDGTRAFVCGMAQWGTLIALNDGVKPIMGVLDQPYLGERWSSVQGKTRFRRHQGPDRVLKTRACRQLATAVLSTTSPVGYFDESETRAFWSLSNQAQLTRFGGDCYAYGLLAMGFIDVIVEAGLKPWDIQALIPIIEQAGGVVTDWQGVPCPQGGQVVACGDPALLPAVLQALADGR